MYAEIESPAVVVTKPVRLRQPLFPQHRLKRRLPLSLRPRLQRKPQKIPLFIAQTPCWIISLHPEGGTVYNLLETLKSQRLRTALVSGVDGRSALPRFEGDEVLCNRTTRWRHLCALKNSEVGCYLAHLRAIRLAYQTGLNRVCILEDDVQLEPDFGKILAELERLPEEIEMIRLMGLKVRKRKIIKTLNDGIHKLVRPERGWCGAQGYLLNRKGMEKILGHANRIFEPIDKVFDHFWQFDLKLYGVEPHLLWETAHTSSIVKSNVGRAKVARWLYWVHPFGKLWRSVERHIYLLRHYQAFYPAQKPKQRPGRTARMKL
ncbi:glycosyltransferase family 25 protein [Microbulbifer variabilis]|uniref:glycosyltransferase family 25 protein n=1 Tax=Microbulbifer variabilis TaxID=266805 RepID=UPI00036965B9|nr:glycosyltransferase family 25 protein [Microbulbifer variabilis]